ncbi:MAG: RNA polymerase sigma factor [Parcubacteria group bacterium]
MQHQSSTRGEAGPQGLSEAALAELMARYGPALRRYFLKRVSPLEAEDLVQDVFVAMQVRGGVDDVEHVNRYLFRIAANVMARRRMRPTWDWRDGRRSLDDMPDLVEEVSPERALIGKEAIEQLVVVLRDLPPRASEAFLLNRFEEMTYSAVAAHMGISVKAVEKHIKRALARIADAVEPLS